MHVLYDSETHVDVCNFFFLKDIILTVKYLLHTYCTITIIFDMFYARKSCATYII